jgi:hypothetical protein
MPTDILDIAKSQKGVGESSGTSKYGKWLDAQAGTHVYYNADWCGAFQLWCIAQGGEAWLDAAGGLRKDYAYVQDWYDWMKAHGRLSKTPKARRLVWYDWAGTPDGANHIGMVDHFTSTHIWAWEGNKDNKVQLVERPRDSQIMGYGEWWGYIAVPADDDAVVMVIAS